MAATMTGTATEAIMMASAIRLMFVVTAKAPLWIMTEPFGHK
jgi:hypothetical protein